MATRTRWLLVLTLTCGCGRQGASPPQSASTGSAPAAAPVSVVPFAQRIGWVDRSCLAIANKTLSAGAAITVVSLDDKSTKLLDGRVLGITASSEKCPALLADRRSSNVAEGWSFYELELAAKVNLGIGVIGEARRVEGGLDLDGDGAPEKFTQCATSEGVSFGVWRATPYRGVPLWSGYYYLGYDTEANCPPQ